MSTGKVAVNNQGENEGEKKGNQTEIWSILKVKSLTFFETFFFELFVYKRAYNDNDGDEEKADYDEQKVRNIKSQTVKVVYIVINM